MLAAARQRSGEHRLCTHSRYAKRGGGMKRGVYLVPSLLTLANLAAGVLSIILAASDHYTSAAWAIIAGILLDMMDGRVARWMGATSQFGLELDSLADLTSFGVA